MPWTRKAWETVHLLYPVARILATRRKNRRYNGVVSPDQRSAKHLRLHNGQYTPDLETDSKIGFCRAVYSSPAKVAISRATPPDPEVIGFTVSQLSYALKGYAQLVGVDAWGYSPVRTRYRIRMPCHKA